VIVNPSAGHGRARTIWPEVERALKRQGLDFEAELTSGPGDATRLAASAARSGADLVVTIGGDGTVNEVVNGLLAGEGLGPPTLGVIACGSGCDFVRSLGLPKGVGAVDAIAAGLTKSIDVGRATYQGHDGETASRYFANCADLGFGAEVADRVNRSGKPLGGFLTFLGYAVVTLVGASFKSIDFSSDGGTSAATRAGMILVANGQYAAGGMHFAPAASVDDGLFDVVLLHEVGKPTLIGELLPKVYLGAHIGHRAITHFRARELSVSSSDPLFLELDGELPGRAPASFSLIPRALRVVVPAARG
jgi:YegS/Rv2252/BmrU family lipid kinase